MQKKPHLIFFIGTTAELIKLFTVIREVKARKIPFKVIATGQNDIDKTDIIDIVNIHIDLKLSEEKDITKNAIGLFLWEFITGFKAKKQILEAFPDVDFKKSIMIVHGDTISTVMGAAIAKSLKMKLAHIEAGLRTGVFYSPFPEEIDRHIVSRLSDYNFCQNAWAVNNLKKAKGENYNTEVNTIFDALTFSETLPIYSPNIYKLTKEINNYVVVVFHRQENVINKRLTTEIINRVLKLSSERNVIFIMHKITEDALKKYGLYELLNKSENITLLRRVEYFDFMKILQNADFVMTDGGSNQEELACMGKPTVILRKYTERTDGLKTNVVLSKLDMGVIDDFINNYKNYQYDKQIVQTAPSAIISSILEEKL